MHVPFAVLFFLYLQKICLDQTKSAIWSMVHPNPRAMGCARMIASEMRVAFFTKSKGLHLCVR